MTRTTLISVAAFIFPVLVFLAGGKLMEKASGIDRIPDRPAIGMRPTGISVEELTNYWGRLTKKELTAEQKFLEFDLVFPILYCSAIALGLLVLWKGLGLNVSLLWILAPVVLALVADWAENILLLSQLNRVIAENVGSIEPGMLSLARVCTVIKFWSAILAGLLLLSLMIASFFSPSD